MKEVPKRILYQLNIVKKCRDYGVGLWQCPTFLFIIMGVIIIGSMLITYFVALIFVEPEIVIGLIVAETIILLIISFSIVKSFETLAMANKMKSEFVSVASHQLRTPLSSVKWSLDLFLTGRLGTLPPKQMEYLRTVKQSTDRMIKLVSDLLSVSRIEEGRIKIKIQPIELEEIIIKEIKDVTLLAKSKNVQIVFKPKGKFPQVWADPALIRIVIQNFLNNAVQYIGNKKGLVEIELKKKNSKFITFSIKDNGVGIPKEQQSRIFQKFFRADNVLKHRTVGTGLGLFISKAIIKSCKGKVWFKSKEDVGTTFYFTLPLNKK